MWRKTLISTVAVLSVAVLFAPNLANALTVQPAIRELTLTPGDSTTAVIELKNDSLKPVSLTSEMKNFTAKGETGEPLYLDTAPTGAATWASVKPATLEIPAGQKTEVAVTFATPANASPGGHYIGVLFAFRQTGATNEGQLNIESKVAVPFLLTVSGAYKEKGAIVTFQSDKAKYSSGPVAFSFQYQNTGDVHLKPVGNVTISSMFGKTVKTIAVNAEKGAVLPGTTRTYDVAPWTDVGSGFGKYTATISVAAGGLTNSATVSFWVVSTTGILIAVVILIAIIIIFAMLVRVISRRNPETQSPKQ